jgi:RNA recognition motif-containing protein
MKVSSQGGKKKDSILMTRNRDRVATAGRRGTKKFVDPGKVFVGGLPFDATEKELKNFFVTHLGHDRNIASLKIIRDWQTQKSKGYGFVIFSDPMFATCAMEFCKNKKLKGRILTLSQGQKKLDANLLYVKKNKKVAENEEEAAIQAGMETAEGGDVSPVAVEEQEGELASLQDFEESDDDVLFNVNDEDYDENYELVMDDDDDDDEEFQYDGVFEEMYPVEVEALTEEELAMNREQRREAQKRKPRRKLPAMGFGEEAEAIAKSGAAPQVEE